MSVNILIEDYQSTDHVVSDELFGTNYLFHRQDVENFKELVDKFLLSGARYPGGSITEEYFDINEPDRVPVEFDEKSTENFTGLSDFLEACNSARVDPTIVIPTRIALTVDGKVDEAYLDDLREFILETMDRCGEGKEFPEISIDAFEIGNEYWGSGQLTSSQYGLVANSIAKTIQSAIDSTDTNADDEPKILVQLGSPVKNGPDFAEGGFFHDLSVDSQRAEDLGLSSQDFLANGELRWVTKIEVANKLIIDQLDPQARAAIDGLVEHYYYTDSYDSNPGLDFTSASKSYIDLKLDVWRDEGFDQGLHLTEWNIHDQNYEQLGLVGSGVLISQISNMVRMDVESANIWPLQHNTSNDIAGHFDEDPALTVMGGAFYLMSHLLPGQTLLENLYEGEDAEVITYGNGDKYNAIVISRSTEIQDYSIKLPHFGDGVTQVTVTRLGVDSDGEHWLPGQGHVETLDYLDHDGKATINSEVYKLDQSNAINLSLSPYEVIVISYELSVPIEIVEDMVLTGSLDDDILVGNAGNDTIRGLAGDDRLSGKSGHDKIWGGHGEDSLFGEVGNDTLGGGGGADKIMGGLGKDAIFGGGGNDLLFGESDNDRIFGGPGDDTIWGGTENDVLWGNAGADQIGGGAGDDTVNGGAGNDVLWGGGGADVIFGGGNNDTIVGDYGNDSLFGNGGSDELWGGGGDDFLDGGWGNDSVNGGVGSDTLLGSQGSDALSGGLGDDKFQFLNDFGISTIQDFAPNEGDFLEISTDLLDQDMQGKSISDILHELTHLDNNDRLVIDFQNGRGIITLEGIDDIEDILENVVLV